MTRGPRPKENAVRRNAHPFAQALPDAAQEGRELPKALGIKTGGARRFWKTWSTAPQTQGWAETDWAELELTTKLVDALYQGELKLAGEIRQRVAKWGATVEDRARLRMTLESPEEDPQEAQEVPQAVDMDEELYKLLNGN
ncbi:hypothetical protein OG897_08525 [Streptomyces sp. NBC_00237]|uniref:phage terminase small subunit n=1 Tax=Streptomyces sp. NBC_00237 TaxID=2975687 RepID=UPI00224E63A2|nr:hypothetical protein [Streptomyces sp. NBC_00237]MCX5201496.1 hypothetical protein [Streptomyces sp. NBC_00237]